MRRSNVALRSLVEIERRVNRACQFKLLLVEQPADLPAEACSGDGRDVVTGDGAPIVKSVGRTALHLRREATDCCCDGGDGDRIEVRSDKLSSEHEHRTRLV